MSYGLKAIRFGSTSKKNTLLVQNNLLQMILCGPVGQLTDPALGRFTNLKTLFIEGTHYVSDKSLSRLVHLEKFRIFIYGQSYETDNSITEKSISRLTNLVSLSLGFGCVGDETLSLLTNLRKLELGGNQLVTDGSLKKMTQLRKLIIYESMTTGSKTGSITGSSVSLLTNLRQLFIGYCDNPIFTDDCLGELTNLEKLNIFFNENFTDRSISKLTNLRELSFSPRSNITETSVSLLTNLQNLSLSGNTSITPNVLSILTNIHTLDLEDNEIIDEDCLRHLPKLRKLTLFGNKKISKSFLLSLSESCEIEKNNSNSEVSEDIDFM